MSKKVNRYCSILNYIEDISENKLFYVIKKLCLLSNFSPRYGNSLTFLFPDDKLYKKIEELAFSFKGEDVEKAIQLVKSLILLGEISNGGKFQTINKKIIDVKEDGGKLYANGTLIKKDSNFASREDINNIFVYRISELYKKEPEDTVEQDTEKRNKKFETDMPEDTPIKKIKKKKTGGNSESIATINTFVRNLYTQNKVNEDFYYLTVFILYLLMNEEGITCKEDIGSHFSNGPIDIMIVFQPFEDDDNCRYVKKEIICKFLTNYENISDIEYTAYKVIDNILKITDQQVDKLEERVTILMNDNNDTKTLCEYLINLIKILVDREVRGNEIKDIELIKTINDDFCNKFYDILSNHFNRFIENIENSYLRRAHLYKKNSKLLLREGLIRQSFYSLQEQEQSRDFNIFISLYYEKVYTLMNFHLNDKISPPYTNDELIFQMIPIYSNNLSTYVFKMD
jgi:hypothetical protein